MKRGEKSVKTAIDGLYTGFCWRVWKRFQNNIYMCTRRDVSSRLELMESIVFVCVENYLKNLKNKSFRKTQLLRNDSVFLTLKWI